MKPGGDSFCVRTYRGVARADSSNGVRAAARVTAPRSQHERM